MRFWFSTFTLFAIVLLSAGCAGGGFSQPLDKRLVGHWEGLREEGVVVSSWPGSRRLDRMALLRSSSSATRRAPS